MSKPSSAFPMPLPAKAGKIFQGLLCPLSPENVEDLRAQLDSYRVELLGHLENAQKQDDTNRLVNLQTGLRMIATAGALLAEPQQYPPQHGEWIAGAVRYLVERQDSNEDFLDPFGLDDDLAVMNAVLEAIGRRDLVISR